MSPKERLMKELLLTYAVRIERLKEDILFADDEVEDLKGKECYHFLNAIAHLEIAKNELWLAIEEINYNYQGEIYAEQTRS